MRPMLKKIMNDRFWIFIVLLYHERDQKSFKFASTTSDSAICLKDFNKAIAYVYRDVHKEIFFTGKTAKQNSLLI